MNALQTLYDKRAKAWAECEDYEAVDERITDLEATVRMTSICGLGQVALGPVVSVLGLERGGAEAREHPKGPTPA